MSEAGWVRRWFVYRIKVRGTLDGDRSKGFRKFIITPQGNGETVMLGALSDQAALPGVIGKIEDLGLDVLSVEQWGRD